MRLQGENCLRTYRGLVVTAPSYQKQHAPAGPVVCQGAIGQAHGRRVLAGTACPLGYLILGFGTEDVGPEAWAQDCGGFGGRGKFWWLDVIVSSLKVISSELLRENLAREPRRLGKEPAGQPRFCECLVTTQALPVPRWSARDWLDQLPCLLLQHHGELLSPGPWCPCLAAPRVL